jgi:phenylacetate-CoA ligase
MEWTPCSCGDPSPKILDLEGRAPVLFRAADGSVVNAIDVGRVLREFAVVQHEVVQRADGSCEVAYREAPGAAVASEALEARLRVLLGAGVPLSIHADERLGDRLAGGKVQPYRTEMPSEE